MQKRLISLASIGLTLALTSISPALAAAADDTANAIPAAAVAQGKPLAAPAYTTTNDGLKYADLHKGAGAAPKTGDLVTVKYVGALENGTVFDRSADHTSPQNPDGTFSFHIGRGEVIKGWDEGVATMRPGGRRKLIIPSALGYGEAGAGQAIPPNATLVFEVTLVKTEHSK